MNFYEFLFVFFGTMSTFASAVYFLVPENEDEPDWGGETGPNDAPAPDYPSEGGEIPD